MSNTRADRSAAAASSSLAIIGAFACIACTLLLIAATIVLALIPVFLSRKEVTPNSNTLRSKQADAYLGVNGDPKAGTKRSINNITDLVGYSLDPTSYSSVQNLFLKYLPTNIVSGITLNNVTLVNNPTGNGFTYALHILFVVLYKPSCLYACQINNAASLKQKLKGISTNGTSSDFSSLIFLTNDGPYTLIITGFGMGYVEDIIPATSSQEVTDLSTTTTTSASTVTSGNTSNSSSSG